METDITFVIDRMKKSVMERCRERMIHAADMQRERHPVPDACSPTCGISIFLKRARGL